MSFSDRDALPSSETRRHEGENEAEYVDEEQEQEQEEEVREPFSEGWAGGEVQPSAPLSVSQERPVSSSIPSPFLSHSSQAALKDENFSPPRYSNLSTNRHRQEMPPPQYSVHSSASPDALSSIVSSSWENGSISASLSPRHKEMEGEDREGSAYRSALTSSTQRSDGGHVPPLSHSTDPVPLVSDEMANPIKMPWRNGPPDTAAPSSSVPFYPSKLPLSPTAGWNRGGEASGEDDQGEEDGSGSPSLPYSETIRPHDPPPPTFSAAYPIASYVPPPEELVTMGVTMEEYRRRTAEAAAAAVDRENGKLFAPHWLVSMANICNDAALVADAICCPCCLLAADTEAFLRPERVTDPMTVNCHPLTAIGLTVTSLCTGSILGTVSVQLLEKACCCPGCVCMMPVVSIAAIVLRTFIRRRYHIRGCLASPGYTFLPASSFPGGGRGGGNVAGPRSDEQQEWSNANPSSTTAIHGVLQSNPVSSSPTMCQRIGEVCADVCCGLWCVWCVMLQNHRELVYRKGYQGKIVFSCSRALPTYEIQ